MPNSGASFTACVLRRRMTESAPHLKSCAKNRGPTQLYPQTGPEMNSEDLNRFLTQSLADRKLSGGEKSALTDWLARNVTTDQHRGLVRHVAFEVARSATTDPAAADL